MTRDERGRARRISEYVDGLVVQQRTREECTLQVTCSDREFRELTALATELSTVRVLPAAGLQEELLHLLPRMADDFHERSKNGSFAYSMRRVYRAARMLASPLETGRVPRLARTAAVLVSLVVAIGVIWRLGAVSSASAAEILSLADSALTQLVGPGDVLYRRWAVVNVVHNAPGAPEVVEERVHHEWMDGTDFGRVAGRIERSDGRLLLAYTKMREEGQLCGHVYFAPGFSNEPHGLLSVEPSRREFDEAACLFPPKERRLLQTYLARGYIYEPISGERRFNRTVLDLDGLGDGLPRVRLSVEHAVVERMSVYNVKVVDPLRVRFRWTSQGPPVVWLERRETTRVISRNNYLSLGSQELKEFEKGRRVFTTRRLIETSTMKAAEAESAFDLRVPEGTPVCRQSAAQLLSEVARALVQASAERGLPREGKPPQPD